VLGALLSLSSATNIRILQFGCLRACTDVRLFLSVARSGLISMVIFGWLSVISWLYVGGYICMVIRCAQRLDFHGYISMFIAGDSSTSAAGKFVAICAIVIFTLFHSINQDVRSSRLLYHSQFEFVSVKFRGQVLPAFTNNSCGVMNSLVWCKQSLWYR